MSAPKSKPNAAHTKKPASSAKRAANRANAQRSTGPRTESGKARSCSNRFGRGFFVERLLVETLARREDPDEFATLHMRWHQTLRPMTEVEADLVEKICANQHQVQRLTELEGMLLEWYSRERGMEGVAEWFKRAASRQAAIATLDRAAQRWLRELARQQAARLKQAPQWSSLLPSPETQFLLTEPPGFVGAHADPEAAGAAERMTAAPAAERAALTGAEPAAKPPRHVPLPPGYRYTPHGIVHENDPPAAPAPAASPGSALPGEREGEAPATPPPPRVPLKFRYPTPYPGQAPYPPLGANDPVVRYPHLAAVSSGPGSPAAGNGAAGGNGAAPAAPLVE